MKINDCRELADIMRPFVECSEDERCIGFDASYMKSLVHQLAVWVSEKNVLIDADAFIRRCGF